MKKIPPLYIKKLFSLYSVIMIWLLFGQRIGFNSSDTYIEKINSNINLTPFYTIQSYFRDLFLPTNLYLQKHAFINLAGNIVMFIPLGALLPFIFPKTRNFFKCLATSTLIIACIEIIQLFTLLGSCDIDDFILNIAGVFLGYLIYKTTERIWT